MKSELDDGVPPPPRDIGDLLQVHRWNPENAFVRVHDLRFGATEFHSGSEGGVKGRFHFIRDAEEQVVPAMYGGENEEVGLAETVFRDVRPGGEGRVIVRSRTHSLGMSTIRPARPLDLAKLFGTGLRRFGITARNLTDTDPPTYPATARWAEAAHHARENLDGLVWMSRHHNDHKALLLFGDRIRQDELIREGRTVPLLTPRGSIALDRMANALGVVLL